MLYGFEVVSGEGGPEQDRGPVRVFRGDIDVRLAEAVPDGLVGVVVASAGGTAGGETEAGGSGTEAGEERTTGERGNGQDRKSTRLNSSHVAISYAVFCLKKKNS